MQPKRSSTGELLIACLRWATIAVCFGSIALVFGVIALRLGYPYQLEWMEGAVLQHIHVVQSGRVPYSEPSILFSPFFYTPLFYYVSAAVMLLTGDGFLGPRLVSIGASVASAALVYALVRGEKGDKLAALCGCAFFAASYWPTGRWFDLARVDSLYVFFALAGAFAIRHGRHPAWPFAAGLLFCLACLTKQTAAVIALPLFAWCLAFRPRELLRLIGSFAVFSLAAFAWLQWSSDGWFGYCMFGLSSGHPLKARGVETFLLRDLALQIPIALTLIAAAVVVGRREWPRSASQGFLLALVAGGVIASFVIRIKVGAWTNNLMPAYAVLAVAFGVAVARLRALPQTKFRLPDIALVLVGLQLLFMLPFASPWKWVPTTADRAAGDRLVELIASVEGDVLVPTATHLAERVGKAGWAHFMNVRDVQLSSRSRRQEEKLLGEFDDALRRGQFDLILLHNPQRDYFVRLPAEYEYRGRVFPPGVFEPTSGSTLFVPAYLYVRRGVAIDRME